MNREQQMVKEFHQVMQLTVCDKPKQPNYIDYRLRCKLIEEESQEHKEAKTIVEIADALGDLLYVVYGAAVTYGLDMEPIFAEIHRSNMTKLWTYNEYIIFADSSYCSITYVNTGQLKSYLVKNKDGKVIKSPSYSPANLKPIIEAQLNERAN